MPENLDATNVQNLIGIQRKKTVLLHPHTQSLFARMAELVDALVSGTSIRKGVQVRVLFRAQANQRKSR
jgi:hypothetical protein